MLLILFSMAAMLFFSTTQAASLSAVEKQISKYITRQKDQQLSLLENLVNINSGTANISGVHQVGEILRLQFEQPGFKTRWVEEPANMHRAATLIAEHKGTTGKKLLFIGHLDTVFPKDSLFQKFERHENIAIGPGVIDNNCVYCKTYRIITFFFHLISLNSTFRSSMFLQDHCRCGKPIGLLLWQHPV